MIKNLIELKDRLDILQIIESFLPLRKAGVNYQANCPFHNEKTPSFIVSPTKNIYTCFGCGASGDALKFIQEYKKLTFIEAVEEAANLIGFELEYQKSDKPQTKGLFDVLEKANEIFYTELNHSDNAKILQYLKNRGLDENMLKKYDFGYCSLRALNKLKEQFTQEQLESAGLLKNGKCFLYMRISIAIRDDNHKLRGFSGRAHPYFNFSSASKYINSAENTLFKKSFIFYGSSLAKSHIKKAQSIIICEGFLDVIAFHKFEYKNAICTIGTAFNKTHLAHIYKLASPDCEIIFSFDNDEAGKNATLRALRLCYENHFYNAFVVRLSPEENAKDMGEFLNSTQKPKMTKIHGFKFFLKTSLESAQNAQAKDRAYNECLKIIAYAPPFVRAEFNAIAKTLLPKSEMLPQIQSAHQNKQNTQHIKNLAPSNKIEYASYNLNNAILRTMLESSEFATIAKNYLSPADFLRSQDFQAALQGDTKALPLVKNAMILDSSEWSISLESFKKQALERQIKNARQNNDFKLIELLRQELLKMQRICF